MEYCNTCKQPMRDTPGISIDCVNLTCPNHTHDHTNMQDCPCGNESWTKHMAKCKVIYEKLRPKSELEQRLAADINYLKEVSRALMDSEEKLIKRLREVEAVAAKLADAIMDTDDYLANEISNKQAKALAAWEKVKSDGSSK